MSELVATLGPWCHLWDRRWGKFSICCCRHCYLLSCCLRCWCCQCCCHNRGEIFLCVFFEDFLEITAGLDSGYQVVCCGNTQSITWLRTKVCFVYSANNKVKFMFCLPLQIFTVLSIYVYCRRPAPLTWLTTWALRWTILNIYRSEVLFSLLGKKLCALNADSADCLHFHTSHVLEPQSQHWKDPVFSHLAVHLYKILFWQKQGVFPRGFENYWKPWFENHCEFRCSPTWLWKPLKTLFLKTIVSSSVLPLGFENHWKPCFWKPLWVQVFSHLAEHLSKTLFWQNSQFWQKQGVLPLGFENHWKPCFWKPCFWKPCF